MHPMLRDLLMDPVGWLTIAVGLVILGIPLATVIFIRRKMRQDGDERG